MNKSNYSYWKVVNLSFDQAIERVTEELQKEGFGILTQVDVTATMKNKLDVDFKPYRILGACNPNFAYQVLQKEEQIGLMLPCNFIVYVNDKGETIVASVNPLSTMKAVNNENLMEFAEMVNLKLQSVIQSL